MFKCSKEGSSGFTLIELMVVITIIGLLASTVLASLSNSRAKARDATRVSDIKQLLTVFELFRNDNGGLYPSDVSGQLVSNLTSGSSNITTYTTIPSDPTYTGPNGYRYRVKDASRNSFTMLIHFETNRTNRDGQTIVAGAWCSVSGGASYGFAGWNGVNESTGVNDGTTYPPCF